jgi:hypothetical protein
MQLKALAKDDLQIKFDDLNLKYKKLDEDFKLQLVKIVEL